jgi:CRISPR-associated protein Csm5
MSPRLFHAVALTPVHVEDPAPWTPDCFALDDDALVLFDPAAAVAGLDEGARRGFALAVDRGDLRLAQDVLRASLRPEQALDRIRIGAASRGAILDAFADPARPGRVLRFARSGGLPCVPGSTLKGALRTALLSARAQDMLPELRRIAAREDARTGRTGRLSDEIQRAVFGAGAAGGGPDGARDVFRFLRVADGMPGPGCTRIERVFNRRRDGRIRDMLVDAEMLCAGTVFALALAADAGVAGAPDLEETLAACDGFFRQRWLEERARFYAASALPADLAPVGGGAILLRVGRYAHFESASIDGLRQGWNQARRAPMAVGDSRAVTLRGDLPVPFGWLALFADATAAQAAAQTQRRMFEPPPRPPRPAPAPAAAPGADVPGPAGAQPAAGPKRKDRGRNAKRPREQARGEDRRSPDAGAPAAKPTAKPAPTQASRKPASQPAPRSAPKPAPRPARILQFRRGERVRDPASGEIAIVAADVPIGAAHMEVDFPDGPMRVDPRGWRKV